MTAHSRRGPMTSLHDVLEAPVSNGSVAGAVALVARGDDVEVEAVGTARHRRHCSDGQGLDLSHRLGHQAHHRGRRHAARRRRPDRARRPRRRVAAGARVADRRAHAVQSRRRRRAGREVDHRGRSAHVARRLRLPGRLLAPGRRSCCSTSCRDTGATRSSSRRRTTGWRRCPASRCCTSPARPGSTTPAPTSRAC